MLFGYYYLSMDVSARPSMEYKITRNYAGDRLFSLLAYDKELVTFNDDKIKCYRSVVFSFPERKLLCFSPPSITTLQNFINPRDRKSNCIEPSKYTTNEYIDGLMLNLFFDTRTFRWELAVKYNTGGKQRYRYNKPSSYLAQRYIDIFKQKLQYEGDLMKSPIIKMLSTDHSYSFVCSYRDEKLYLVAVYEINELYARFVEANDYENWECFANVNGVICFPKRYYFDSCSMEEIEMDICSHNIDGVVYTSNDDGKRYKVLNYWYNIRKQLRSVNSIDVFTYLCLRRKKGTIIKKDLFKYRKERNLFYKFIEYLYDLYIRYYQKKEGITITDKWRFALEQIHNNVYKHRIIHNKERRLTKKDVFNYFEREHPHYTLYLMDV